MALYLVRDFRQTAPHIPDREIAKAGFFAPDAPPEGTTRGTKARLAEFFSKPISAYW